jgi:hypothetical protein
VRYALTFVVLLLTSWQAQAEILLAELGVKHYSLTAIINHHGIPGPPPPTELRFSFRLFSGEFGACCLNSFGLVRSVPTTQVGQIETLGSGDVTEIAAVLDLAVSQVLNGQNQSVRAMIEGGSYDDRFPPSILPPSARLDELLANPGVPSNPSPATFFVRADLHVPLTEWAAHPIRRVQWRVDDWWFNWPHGLWGSAGGAQTLLIFGAVPEPAGLMLFFIGVMHLSLNRHCGNIGRR